MAHRIEHIGDATLYFATQPRWFHHATIDDLFLWVGRGWKLVDTYWGTHHAHHDAIIVEWTGEGEPG